MTTPSEVRDSALSVDERAPFWHTALLVGLMLAVALTGVLLQRYAPHAAAAAPPATGSQRRSQYLTVLCVNWGLVLYVSRLFRARNALPSLLGARFRGVRQMSIDVALAFAVCALIQLLQVLLTGPLSAGRNAAVLALLPSTEAERLMWAVVAVSVGFCEEVVFRGYLQKQLGLFTGSRSVGIFLQAVLFGVAHAEQGLAAALRVGCYGLIFGVLAQARRSLLPGIASHVAIDLASLLWPRH